MARYRPVKAAQATLQRIAVYGLNRSYKPITASLNGLDKTLAFYLAKRSAEFRNVDRKVAFFEKASVPYISQDLVFCNDFFDVLDQVLENVKGFGCQLKGLPFSDDRSLGGIQKAVSEFIYLHAGKCCRLESF